MRRSKLSLEELLPLIAAKCGGVNKSDLKLIVQTALDTIARAVRAGPAKVKYLGVFSPHKNGVKYTPNWEIQDKLWREWELVPRIKHNRPSQYW